MIVLATQNETRRNGRRLEIVVVKYRSLRVGSHWCGKGVKEGNERSERGLALTFVLETRRISRKLTLLIRSNARASPLVTQRQFEPASRPVALQFTKKTSGIGLGSVALFCFFSDIQESYQERCPPIFIQCPWAWFPPLTSFWSVDAQHRLTSKNAITSFPHCGFGIGKTSMDGKNILKQR